MYLVNPNLVVNKIFRNNKENFVMKIKDALLQELIKKMLDEDLTKRPSCDDPNHKIKRIF
jgi:hypothetical protein